MKHLLGLSFKDLIYMKSKSVPVGYVYNDEHKHIGLERFGSPGKAKVTKLDKKDEPWAMKEAIMGHNPFDLALFDGANAKLDEHIRTIGAERFAADLLAFNTLQDAATVACGSRQAAETYVGGGYDSKKDCYWADNGCAIRCLLQFYTEYQKEHKRAGFKLPQHNTADTLQNFHH